MSDGPPNLEYLFYRTSESVTKPGPPVSSDIIQPPFNSQNTLQPTLDFPDDNFEPLEFVIDDTGWPQDGNNDIPPLDQTTVISPVQTTLSDSAFQLPALASCSQHQDESRSLYDNATDSQWPDPESLWLTDFEEPTEDHSNTDQQAIGNDSVSRDPPTKDTTARHDIAAIPLPWTPSSDRSLIDLPTFLIEHWFGNTSKIWSGFDSSANMNRQLAQDAFAHHEGLFYSLQSMAASYLADRLPHLKQISIVSTHQALQAIKLEAAAVKSLSMPDSLPKSLLLAMICIGTSACWTEPAQLGLPLLRVLKSILVLYNEQALSMSLEDRQALLFFNQSCLYWDMLCRVVNDAEDAIGSVWSDTRLAIGPLHVQFHPWTGISTDILELFTQSIALCRRFRSRIRQLRQPTVVNLQASLQDFREAHKLQEKVEKILLPEVSTLPETGDPMTPRSHYAHVARAYQLASLLVLRQTFMESVTSTEEVHRSYEDLQRLALSLITLLGEIPISSNTHSLQPVLLLIASTGLKYNIRPCPPEQRLSKINDSIWDDLADCPSNNAAITGAEEVSISDLVIAKRNSLAHFGQNGGHNNGGDEPSIDRTSLEVADARQFIQERLNVLENRLAAKPVLIVKQLVKQIWLAYDEEIPGEESSIHWIDVMMHSGLGTIFG